MSSKSPFTKASKESTVSSMEVKMPDIPVKTSATNIGCERKRWTLRARETVTLSSSDSSSSPKMAMMS